MRRIPVINQHQAGAGIARVDASFPCTQPRASWFATFTGMTKDHKPEPRRQDLTS